MYAALPVAFLLPKLLITNQVTLKCDRIVPFHKDFFYPYGLSLFFYLIDVTSAGDPPDCQWATGWDPLFKSALLLSGIFCFHGNLPPSPTKFKL